MNRDGKREKEEAHGRFLYNNFTSTPFHDRIFTYHAGVSRLALLTKNTLIQETVQDHTEYCLPPVLLQTSVSILMCSSQERARASTKFGRV